MTFKELSFKKKLEHIWEYYKLIILGVIFIIFVICTIFYSLVINPRHDTYAGVAIYDQYLNQEQLEGLEADVDAALSLPKDKTVRFTTYYFDEDDDVFNVDMQQKFMTYLYTLETHLIAAYRAAFENFVSSGYIAPLTDYYSEEELSALDEKGRLIYFTDPEDNTEKPFGISLYDSALFNKYDVFDTSSQPAYIGIFPAAGFEESSRAAADEIIKAG